MLTWTVSSPCNGKHGVPPLESRCFFPVSLTQNESDYSEKNSKGLVTTTPTPTSRLLFGWERTLPGRHYPSHRPTLAAMDSIALHSGQELNATRDAHHMAAHMLLFSEVELVERGPTDIVSVRHANNDATLERVSQNRNDQLCRILNRRGRSRRSMEMARGKPAFRGLGQWTRSRPPVRRMHRSARSHRLTSFIVKFSHTSAYYVECDHAMLINDHLNVLGMRPPERRVLPIQQVPLPHRSAH